jgi:hypothetical protein
MKKALFFFFFSSFFSLLYGQKSFKIELGAGNNYGFKFEKKGFYVGIPFELKKGLSSFSIVLQYARKHNLTRQQAYLKIDTILPTWTAFKPLHNYHYGVRQFKMDYLQIPLEYKHYFKNRPEIFFKLGGYISYAFSGKVSQFEYVRKESITILGDYEPIHLNTDTPFSKLSFTEQNIKKWDKGYRVGLGFTLLQLDVTLLFEQSFDNLNYSNDAFTQMKNKGLYLMASLPFFPLKYR